MVGPVGWPSLRSFAALVQIPAFDKRWMLTTVLSDTSFGCPRLCNCFVWKAAPSFACWEVGAAQEGAVPSLSNSHRPSADWAQVRGRTASMSNCPLHQISKLFPSNQL